ncbi:MAG: lamin tail domain-containing protein [Planctomycetota bacterium]|nr:lamin tail domain-containing protein [Planctomycetota bacterium]
MSKRLGKVAASRTGRTHRQALSHLLRVIWPSTRLGCAVAHRFTEALEPRQLLAANVVINEIMYHPGYGGPGDAGYIAENVKEEYIELANTGSSAANLKNWHFNQGVDYTFPDVTIGVGQYLVVAADLTAFKAKHPSVSNVISAWTDAQSVAHSWTGTLSNNGEDIELENDVGQRVDFVSYSSEGDWAKRRRITDPEYPSGIKGWGWVTGADAGRKSLELINPGLSNEYGQNWAASTPDQGTPGVANSVAATDIAPVIFEVKHYPLIPKPADPVTLTARIADELGTNATVTLYHRIDGGAVFSAAAMYDDGQHGDGLAGDGLYGAVLPAQADKTTVEFYVRATDAGGKTRFWPASTNDAGAEHGANALYQVDATTYADDQPIYHIVVTKAEWDAWYAQMGQGHPADYSNAEMNATFLSIDGAGTEQRYLVGVRNRGEGSRGRTPHNFQVEFPRDHTWHGLSSISLNTQYTWPQVAGNAVFSMAGLPAPYGKPVQVRVNGMNLASSTGRQYGSYFFFEPYNGDWADNHLPQDSNGNIYKGTMYGTYGPADFRWVPDGTPGASSDWYTKAGYTKQTNTSADDWSDLVNLLYALNKTPDAQYTQQVSKVVNVDEWLTYFAVNFLIGNRENSLGGTDDNTNPSIVGDDYSMYSGELDKRFQLLVHDMDTVLGQGDTAGKIDMPLFATWRVAAVDKLLKWKDFAPRYFEIIKQQIDTTFSPGQINPLLDQMLSGWIPASNIADMKKFVVDRNAWVLSQIPLAISATNPPTTSTTSTVSLTGLANAITTRSVRVNGVLATWSAWEAKWTAPSVSLHGGVNHIVIQSFDAAGNETDHTYADVRYDKGPATTVVGGTLAADTTWTVANSPYQLTSSLTIPSGRTLTIQPGASVYLGNATTAVNITVDSGGRIIADGTNAQRIVLSGIPGASYSWGGISIKGAAGSPETRISYTHIVNNGTTAIDSIDGTVFLDHLTFGTTSKQYVVVDRSSFLIQDCEFPATTGSFEPIHGVGSVKAGGRGIFLRNYFGPITGYNDTIDYTGGQRSGPIVQFIDNVFAGSGDDNLDVDSTDAWVQGNIFLHVHKNGPPDTSSAVSGGDDNGNTSEVTIIGNIIYDVDQVANAKQDNFYTLINNTIVRQTHQGGLDSDGALIVMQDNGMTEGRGMYLDGNIVYDIEKYVRDPGAAVITLSNNILPLAWTGPGTGNTIADPVFKHLPQLSETYFTNWTQAQVMRDWLSLAPGSPAIGTGPNGADKGSVVPMGASISGEPLGTTSQTSATLTVGVNRTGYSIPTAGWPNGSGYTHYKYSLDGGPWSAERPINTPISLTNLANGPHTVDVIGKNDAGLYQDSTILGSDALITHSRTWTVDSTAIAPHIRINEVLALNTSLDHNGSLPDMIELYNDGAADFDLSGYSISDNADLPGKFVFPDGTTLGKGQYLILYADALTADGEIHLGFSIKDEGDSITLFSPPAVDLTRTVVDSVKYGRQIADLSIGRVADGSWALTKPTFGDANVAQALGDSRSVKINEWLADEKVLFPDDFIELNNPASLPVAVGGFFLTDIPGDLPRLQQFDPLGASRYQIRALTFIAAQGNTVFHADSNVSAGADHVDFKLNEQFGMIGLFDSNADFIDHVIYGNQTTDVSQGRTPDGASSLAYYPIPIPGVQNPGITTTGNTKTTDIFDIASGTQKWYFWDKGSTPANSGALTWKDSTYPATGWGNGAALLWHRDRTYPETKRTSLVGIGTDHPYQTYYFRTTFTYNGDATKATGLEMRTILDDGAVLYLNGQEIDRIYMDAGTVTYSTLSNYTVGTAGYMTVSVDLTKLPAGTLKNGANVFAVEVHQCSNQSGSSNYSSDIVWGTTLSVTETTGSAIITNPIPENITNLMKQLRITELMYNPVGSSDYEYIELKNTGATTLDVSGVRLAGGIDFVFPTMSLGAGQYVLVVANKAAFESRYGTSLNVAGEYSGVLSNSGNHVILQLPKPYDAGMLRFDYNPTWYPATNGSGRSLVILNPAAAQETWSDKVAWRASAQPGGSPAADDPATIPGSVVISEVLANPANLAAQWVEIHNTTTQSINIAGWYLSDDAANLTQFRIDAIAPATDRLLMADEYLAFSLPFSFDRNAGAIYLSSANPDGSLGSYRENFVYAAADPGVSFGRYVKSDGSVDFVPTSSPAPNTSNAYPLVGPVVISELMYRPVAGDEYIELNNITTSPITLYDPANPSSSWFFADGIVYSFSEAKTKIVIPAYGFLLVVPTLPVDFRAKYGIPGSITIVGPYAGKLDNAGEKVSLARPGASATTITVDSVFYDNNHPWPTAADGTGPSLSRIDSTKYANDLVNWAAASATPGVPNFDTAAPLAIIDAGPDRRESPVDSITIAFTKAVLNFDLSDLNLVREGQVVSLTETSFTTTDNISWTLGNLTALTAAHGHYTLKLTAASSGITDLAGHPLTVDAVDTFTNTAISVTGSAPTDTFHLKVNGSDVEIYKDTTLIDTVPLADLSAINLAFGSFFCDSDLTGLKITVLGASPTTLAFTTSQHLASLNVANGARAGLALDGGIVLRTHTLVLGDAAILDLINNDLIVESANRAELAALIQSARNGGDWTGPGITSTSARFDLYGITGLAIGPADAGQTLIKYTYNGDANLDGFVNADDYFHIDSGYITQAKGYSNGDFNYDDLINADDYFLIDSAYVAQGAPLAESTPTPPAFLQPSPFLSAKSRSFDTLFEDQLDPWQLTTDK